MSQCLLKLLGGRRQEKWDWDGLISKGNVPRKDIRGEMPRRVSKTEP